MEIILVLVIVVIGGLLFMASRQPDEFRVSRSTVIKAPQDVLFNYANDLEKWPEWSPWAKMDPEAVIEHMGPRAGEGATFKWNGKKTGQGVMTITDSRPYELVRYRLEFFKPMKGVSTAEFNYAPAEHGTQVTWLMYGENNFVGKCMGLFMNCEKMIGKNFEEGFENLKAVSENPPSKAA